MEQIYLEDIRNIADCGSVDFGSLSGATVLVTGATGLIGATLVRGLMGYNRFHNGRISVIAYVRNESKARQMFFQYLEDELFQLAVGDVNQFTRLDGDIDYIIHGASVTSSKDFVDKPVETILTAIEGTKNILELAREKKVKGMVYMSSMEVYGTPFDRTPLTEEKMGYLNPLSVRSSYSESKQMVETLCVAYFAQYRVPVKIVRLAQTFGPGVAADDGRVFAEFARCAVKGNDITLQTKGETERMYLYTADAVTALLTVLTKGENGTAYNAANRESYCSIKEMAEMVASEFGQGKSRVVIDIPDLPNTSYNPVCHVYLECGKLEQLGWKAEIGLKEMYRRMIGCMGI
ncbi:MAG: NAD-dependent epimerase/dehydratase family protein [Clostridium sp.]|nr:NAD-dependent epimerase/dehydratase family protein [Clostridium sp.]